jgi:peptide/nickel transport system permease protein
VTGFLIRRLIQAVIVLLIVTVLSFGMMHLIPGGPVLGMLGPKANPVSIHALTVEMGLNRPLPVQYWIWLRQLLTGNFGFSYNLEQPVRTLLAERLGQSAYIVGLALVIAVALSIPIGLIQARRRNTAVDHFFTTFSFVTYAIPTFFLAVLLRYFFQDDLGWIPVEDPVSSFHDALTEPLAIVLPVATLVISSIAGYSRYVRSAVLDQITQDYVRTAIAKGASARRVLYAHVLRNAMIPMLTLIGLSLPALVGGALIVENVFNIPGIGLLTVTASLTSDYPTVLGTTVLVTVATIVGSLIADIGYAALDPRVRLD